MAVERKIYVKKHLVAFFITVIIFVVGLLIGIKVSDYRLERMQNVGEKQRADFESLQLQYSYLAGTNGSCAALTGALEENVNDLENARVKLENYLQASYEEEDFMVAKRSYMLIEIRYWLMARETRKICGRNVANVLYFYKSDEECGDCSAQGTILTFLKEVFKDKLLVFSLDMEAEEPMISILMNVYNVSVAPTVVVEEKRFDGLVVMDELKKEICGNYKDGVEECSDGG